MSVGKCHVLIASTSVKSENTSITSVATPTPGPRLIYVLSMVLFLLDLHINGLIFCLNMASLLNTIS